MIAIQHRTDFCQLGIAKHLAACLQRLARRLERLSTFNSSNDREQIRCADRRNRTLADQGKHLAVKLPLDSVRVRSAPFRLLRLVPLQRDGLEGVLCCNGASLFPDVTLERRVLRFR